MKEDMDDFANDKEIQRLRRIQWEHNSTKGTAFRTELLNLLAKQSDGDLWFDTDDRTNYFNLL